MHKTMRKSAVLKGAVAGIASIAMLMSVSVTANAADTPSYGSAVKPNITSLLGEYYNWWTPKKVVNNTPQGDAFRGKVTDAGKSVLGQNDKTVVAINNKAAADTTKVDGTYTQAERAALDASDGDALRIYKDAFGPIIGQYVAEGVAQGELPKTRSRASSAPAAPRRTSTTRVRTSTRRTKASTARSAVTPTSTV